MKFNLKMIAVAAAMVSAAGAANSALTSASNGNNGSVALVAFNTVTNDWYIRDTGYLINSFLPSSVTTLSGDGAVTGDKTPAAGLTIDKNTTASFADASFSTWYTSQGATDLVRNGNIRWFLSAVDSVGTSASNVKRFLTSSANASETAINDDVNVYVASANAGGLGAVYASGSNGALSSTGTLAPADWLTNFGLGDDGLASLNQSVGLFYFARSTGSGSGDENANATQFGNATGYATVTLAANGDFTYALAGAPVPPSAVPVPAAAWLLGSGLLSFGAFVRRRTAK
jgi:hypothetical protein